MNFLFIHGNFPAQFRHLACILGNNEHHNVVYLTEKIIEDKDEIEGVIVRQYSKHRHTREETHHYLLVTEQAILSGQAVTIEIDNLLKEGYKADVVISHGGNGLGLFIKEILPNAIHIGYFEWYFRDCTTKNLIKDYTFDKRLMAKMRNLPILQELESCDYAVVPTEWQKKQFPTEFQQKLKTIFDGIDKTFFKPCNNELHDEDLMIQNRATKEVFKINKDSTVLTYATRGMEPLRGFPEFMKMLPELMKRVENLQVIIAGMDVRAYSYDAPTHNGSWKNHLLEELGNFEGKEELIFTGLLNYTDYRNLLWRSNLHCYFTREYVTSWSLFEAAACGTQLAVSENEATNNIVEKNSVTWINIDNKHEMMEKIVKRLNSKVKHEAEIIEGYELTRTLRQWQELLNEAIRHSTLL